MQDLTGHWALITGAGRGIGRCTAIAMAKRGIGIIGVARTEADLASLSDEIGTLGGEVRCICLDLSAPDASDALLHSVGDLTEKITIVVFNASIWALGRFDEIPWSIHEKAVNLNVLFPLRFTYSLLPELKKRPQCWLYFLSTQATLQPLPWMATYAATKSCLQSLSLALSREFEDSNVKIVTVIPAVSDTSVFETIGMPADLRKEKFGEGRPAREIADKMVAALVEKPPRIVTNVKGYSLLRAAVGITPVSLLLRTAGKMFSVFNSQGYFPER